MHSALTWTSDDVATVTVSEGCRLIMSSNFSIDRFHEYIDIAIRLAKGVEQRVGQREVCCAISKAYTTALCCCDVMRGYDIKSCTVIGKPRNSRVDFAISFAKTIRHAHNDEVMQRLYTMQIAIGSASCEHAMAEVPLPSGMTISRVFERSECNLCMENTSTRSVTCCSGKRICSPCITKLSQYETKPLKCPWCRR